MDDEQDDLFAKYYEAKSDEELRDEGIARVTKSNQSWMSKATAVATLRLNLEPVDWTGTGEDIRRIVAKEIGNPHSQHAWGALINILSKPKTGILIDTGKVRRMKAAKSHGRRTPLYRRA